MSQICHHHLSSSRTASPFGNTAPRIFSQQQQSIPFSHKPSSPQSFFPPSSSFLCPMPSGDDADEDAATIATPTTAQCNTAHCALKGFEAAAAGLRREAEDEGTVPFVIVEKEKDLLLCHEYSTKNKQQNIAEDSMTPDESTTEAVDYDFEGGAALMLTSSNNPKCVPPQPRPCRPHHDDADDGENDNAPAEVITGSRNAAPRSPSASSSPLPTKNVPRRIKSAYASFKRSRQDDKRWDSDKGEGDKKTSEINERHLNGDCSGNEDDSRVDAFIARHACRRLEFASSQQQQRQTAAAAAPTVASNDDGAYRRPLASASSPLRLSRQWPASFNAEVRGEGQQSEATVKRIHDSGRWKGSMVALPFVEPPSSFSSRPIDAINGVRGGKEEPSHPSHGEGHHDDEIIVPLAFTDAHGRRLVLRRRLASGDKCSAKDDDEDDTHTAPPFVVTASSIAGAVAYATAVQMQRRRRCSNQTEQEGGDGNEEDVDDDEEEEDRKMKESPARSDVHSVDLSSLSVGRGGSGVGGGVGALIGASPPPTDCALLVRAEAMAAAQMELYASYHAMFLHERSSSFTSRMRAAASLSREALLNGNNEEKDSPPTATGDDDDDALMADNSHSLAEKEREINMTLEMVEKCIPLLTVGHDNDESSLAAPLPCECDAHASRAHFAARIKADAAFLLGRSKAVHDEIDDGDAANHNAYSISSSLFSGFTRADGTMLMLNKNNDNATRKAKAEAINVSVDSEGEKGLGIVQNECPKLSPHGDLSESARKCTHG